MRPGLLSTYYFRSHTNPLLYLAMRSLANGLLQLDLSHNGGRSWESLQLIEEERSNGEQLTSSCMTLEDAHGHRRKAWLILPTGWSARGDWTVLLETPEGLMTLVKGASPLLVPAAV